MKESNRRMPILLAMMLALVGFQAAEARMAAQPVAADNVEQTSAGNILAPILIQKVQPVFPGDLRSQVDGDVVMNATIATDGTVRDLQVTHGLPQLIRSAVHAVSQWRYEPARVNGVAVPFKTEIKVSFQLLNHPTTAAAANEAELAAARKPAPDALRTGMPALPPAPAGVVRISGRVMDGMIQKKLDPVYPADAVALDARGVVILLATIGKTGEIADVAVLSGPLRFRDPAINAVKQWRYRPYVMEGKPVEVQTTIRLNFAPPG
jgi:TonB family protein